MERPAKSLCHASVIVCTKNRADALSDFLRSLLALDLVGSPSLELVLVDNNSSDGTPAVIIDFARRAPFPVKHVVEMRRGLGAARNAGVAAASGTVLLFTDDDCIVSPNWVKCAVASFEAEDELRIVGGRIELYNPDHAPLTIKTSMDADELHHLSHLYGFLHGCNFAAHRRVFEHIGLFDARFGAGTRMEGGEDTDFIYRAAKRSVRIFYDPALLVFHNHGRSLNEAQDLLNRYRISNGALLTKHLLAGEFDLLRMAYWEVRNIIRTTRGRDRKMELSAQIYLLVGAWRYLRHGLGRSRA